MKRLGAAVLLLSVLLCFAGCSGKVDMETLKGDWTASKLNGMTIAEFAQEHGYTEDMVAVNVTVTDVQYITTNVNTTGTYYTVPTDKGFDVLYQGTTQVMMSVVYNSFSDTLNYKVEGNGRSYEYELVRGTYDFNG